MSNTVVQILARGEHALPEIEEAEYHQQVTTGNIEAAVHHQLDVVEWVEAAWEEEAVTRQQRVADEYAEAAAQHQQAARLEAANRPEAAAQPPPDQRPWLLRFLETIWEWTIDIVFRITLATTLTTIKEIQSIDNKEGREPWYRIVVGRRHSISKFSLFINICITGVSTAFLIFSSKQPNTGNTELPSSKFEPQAPTVWIAFMISVSAGVGVIAAEGLILAVGREGLLSLMVKLDNHGRGRVLIPLLLISVIFSLSYVTLVFGIIAGVWCGNGSLALKISSIIIPSVILLIAVTFYLTSLPPSIIKYWRNT